MSESCNHDCSSCSQKCDSASFRADSNEFSNVKKVIAVMSGKGGVGKSLVSSLLAVTSARLGAKVGILDADVTGPSIPQAFGLKDNAQSAGEKMILPVETKKENIRVMSINLLLDDPTKPVVWRGPVIAGAVKQFWTDVCWGDLDYMYVDMPPGTGDVPLTVFQSLPICGIVVVTTPQTLVSVIVEKAVKMAGMMNVPIVALVENMSYFECPDCKKRFDIFGKSKIDETAKKYGIQTTARLSVDPELSSLCDKGLIELVEGDSLMNVVKAIEDLK